MDEIRYLAGNLASGRNALNRKSSRIGKMSLLDGDDAAVAAAAGAIASFLDPFSIAFVRHEGVLAVTVLATSRVTRLSFVFGEAHILSNHSQTGPGRTVQQQDQTNLFSQPRTGPEKMVCKTYLRRTQAGPSRRVKEQLEGISPLLHGLANFALINSRTLFSEYPCKLWHFGF